MNKLQDEMLILQAAARKMPTHDEIIGVLNLISKGEPFNNLFFEKIGDPKWLPILDHHGYFSNLPGLTTVENGHQIYPYHLPLIGLARLASIAPLAVTSILAKLEIPENPTIGDQILRCISSIREPACIPSLQVLLTELGGKPNRSSWVWLQELLKNWIEIKAYTDVLNVINSFLSGSVGESESAFHISDSWSIQQVDRIALEFLTPEYSLQIAIIVFNALAKWTERGRKKQYQTFDKDYYIGEDFSSSYWLEDFKTEMSHREFGGVLARRLYLAAENIYRRTDENKIEQLEQLLRSNSYVLFQRLRWQLYADFPEISLSRARNDVLDRIPYLKYVGFDHNYEFAQLLHTFAKKSANNFLSPDEINSFFDVVMSGPINKSGELIKDDYAKNFQRKQLWPISTLLSDDRLEAYKNISRGEMEIQSYKPFRSGGVFTVKHIPPRDSETLGQKSDVELWNLLNTEKSSEPVQGTDASWLREDFSLLGKKFTELLETQPQRFLSTTNWWENIRMPDPLTHILNRAIERIGKDQKGSLPIPTENDWANWYGIAKWTVAQSLLPKDSEKTGPEPHNWYWPRIVVSNFVTATLQSQYPEVRLYITESGNLLKELASAEDSGLLGLQDKQIDDWLTTAINTVRGHAIEGLFELALKQKNAKEEIQPWIFKFICSRLELEEESPAIFALIGGKLRLFVHLFGQKIQDKASILFPANRPLHQSAAIVAHFCFDHPMPQLIDVFPDLINRAIAIMEIVEKEEGDSKKNNRDFASQVGVHIAFYYWNNVLRDEKNGQVTLDRFFAIARSETRAFLIRQIAWIFDKAEPTPTTLESENIYKRVMDIWNTRYHLISERLKNHESAYADHEGELISFTNWLGCECFPLNWRVANTLQCLSLLKKMPELFHLLETLYKWKDEYPDRLDASLQILAVAFNKPSEQLRWSIQSEKLAPLLARGIDSENLTIQAHAKECQELLLKLGFFDLLNIGR